MMYRCLGITSASAFLLVTALLLFRYPSFDTEHEQ
jgi:hypothetical protein